MGLHQKMKNAWTVTVNAFFIFWYLFHLHVTTVACKRSQSFCQKCTWHVTAKHNTALTYMAFHRVM